MKNKFIYSVILAAGLLFAGSSGNTVYSQVPQNTPSKQQTVKYTCPMHSEVVSDKPGNCPKCGMALVEMNNMKTDKMQQMNDTTTMKKDQSKMMKDNTNVKKDIVLPDTSSTKKDPIDK